MQALNFAYLNIEIDLIALARNNTILFDQLELDWVTWTNFVAGDLACCKTHEERRTVGLSHRQSAAFNSTCD
jgi:hypothetical protein